MPDGSRQLVMGIDTLETVGNVNAASGHIYGASFNAQLQYGPKWKLESNLHFTTGKENFFNDDDPGNVIDSLVPASHIPPTYGRTALTYTGKKFTVSASANYFGRKTVDEYGIVNLYRNEDGEYISERDGGSDNIELSYTTAGYIREINANGQIDLICNNPDEEGSCEAEYVGTLAYTTFNLYTSWKINKKMTLNLAVENITDLHYRPFASGISGAGRNFIISLRATPGE